MRKNGGPEFKCLWYFILSAGLKLQTIYNTVYMQTGVNVNTSAIKK
jgi:hypothetical protein